MRSFIFSFFVLNLLLSFSAWPRNHSDRVMSALPKLFEIQADLAIQNNSQWRIRREEIKNILQDGVYGHLPTAVKMEARVVSETPLGDGSGRYRDVRLVFPDIHKEIKLAVFLPLQTTSRTNVFLEMNKCGNQTVIDDPSVTESSQEWLHPVYCFPHGKQMGRGSDQDTVPVKDILARGHILATWSQTEMAADSPKFQNLGVKGALPATNTDLQKNWGALMALAWGYMRAMDYLAQAEGVNPQRVIVVGHSRRAKAALLAAAFDERFAAVIPHQSGVGGTALMREARWRESMNMIANGWFGYFFMNERDGLSHFFAPGFSAISEDPNRFVFDAHFLIALVAPRPLLDFQGKRDFWAGPGSATIALQAANPAWQLLGAGGWNAGGKQLAPQALHTSATGAVVQYIAVGGHKLSRDHWQVFMDFADQQLADTIR